MSVAVSRGRLDIITELFNLTDAMATKIEDSDFLIESVEKRQELMNEYDKGQSSLPAMTPDELASAKAMVEKMLILDKNISTALLKFKVTAKSDLATTNTKQKLMGYVGQAISSSGSYMDFKK